MVNSHGRFVWYELMTTDIEAPRAFYAGSWAGARNTFYRWRFVSGLMSFSSIRLLVS
jgi:hypothetical protein